MASVKFVAVSRGLRGIVDYVTNREKTNESLISGVNCLPQTAVEEFQAVKLRFHKTEGRSYYHIVQAFLPTTPWILPQPTRSVLSLPSISRGTNAWWPPTKIQLISTTISFSTR